MVFLTALAFFREWHPATGDSWANSREPGSYTGTRIPKLADLGRFDEAEDLYLEALAGRRQILGESHHATIVNMSNLGIMYATQGRFVEADALITEAVRIRAEIESRHAIYEARLRGGTESGSGDSDLAWSYPLTKSNYVHSCHY